MVDLTSNAGQNNLGSIVNYIPFWERRKDFKSKHVALNMKVSATKPSKGRLNVSAVSFNQSNVRSVTSIPLMNGGYSSQSIDILFDRRNNFRESKTTIAVCIFKILANSSVDDIDV